MELPPLAFPPHPYAFALAPEPPAVEEEKSLALVCRPAVTQVQARDSLAGRGQDLLVARHALRGRVRPVGKEREADIAVRVREVVHFQSLDLLLDLRGTSQQGRHDDHGSKRRRHAVAKLEARKRARREQGRHDAIQQGDGQIRGRERRHQPEHEQRGRPRAGGPGREKGRGENREGEDGDGSQVPGLGSRDVSAEEPASEGGPEAERHLEGPAAVADEIEAGVILAAVVEIARRRPHDHLAGNLQLRAARAPRELLDGVAVAVAGGKVHRRIAGIRLEHAVDQADALEELRPVQGGHQAHAHDHVTDRHVHGRLPLMLEPHHVVGRRPLVGQPLVQPQEGGRHGGILIAQPLDELHREGGHQRGILEFLEGPGRPLERAAAEPEQLVRERVGGLARRPRPDDALREAPEILDEHHPQGDGDRPQLTDSQRLNALVGLHEPTERVRIEPAIRVGDEGPGDSVDAWVPEERALGQLGQLAVEALGQVVADLAQLLVHDVEIVDQPFRRRRDGALFSDGLGDLAISLAQHAAVVLDAGQQ